MGGVEDEETSFVPLNRFFTVKKKKCSCQKFCKRSVSKQQVQCQRGAFLV